ncbi:hypothetical protein VNO77_03668 [Canavalia gladiata]|uniref:Uncharacterized protein n=1 Tax=Canavalia gladiata TaxID=3824 RepID=A0AAN9N1J3_CANGL
MHGVKEGSCSLQFSPLEAGKFRCRSDASRLLCSSLEIVMVHIDLKLNERLLLNRDLICTANRIEVERIMAHE